MDPSCMNPLKDVLKVYHHWKQMVLSLFFVSCFSYGWQRASHWWQSEEGMLGSTSRVWGLQLEAPERAAIRQVLFLILTRLIFTSTLWGVSIISQFHTGANWGTGNVSNLPRVVWHVYVAELIFGPALPTAESVFSSWRVAWDLWMTSEMLSEWKPGS